jgi:multiple sugar transport system substrate-binding protein
MLRKSVWPSVWSIMVIGVLLLSACAAPVAAPAAEPAAGTTPAPAAAASGEKPYAGLEINVLTFTGPQIAEPLQRRGPDYEALTGAKVNVTVVPFSDLYQKMLTDMATGTNAFDAYVFAPQWMADFIEPGYLEDLTDHVNKDTALEWNDVAPFFRNFSSTYQG